MNYYLNKIGKIEVICGPMFAGKTEELIRRCNRMKFAAKKFIVFKPIIDDRYEAYKVVSHSNLKIDSIVIDHENPNEILKYLNDELEAVVIDEVQFFNKEIITIIDKLAKDGLRVICAGLDLDFKGEPFNVMPQILALADKVTKLTAICAVCKEEATRTQRLINGKPAKYDSPLVLVGEKESYEARCRKCHEVER